jgi:NitT/TauT family transport system ATP-binding protein
MPAADVNMPPLSPTNAPPLSPTDAPLLSALNVSKAFGSVRVIGDLTLSAREGEFLSIVGPSGCGKTTLLMTLAGLIARDGGSITFDGSAVSVPPPGVAVVFQDYSRSLMPWLKNLDNVLFGMRRLVGVSKVDKTARAMDMLTVVGLRGFEGHFPWQVSGGMQQRVAIARALASDSRLLLLDEPLAAVDAQTRGEIQDLLLELSARFRKTCILVTHDVDEAIYMADRVVVLSQRPTVVVHEIVVTLARPRDQILTRSDADFLRLRSELLSMIRSMPKAGHTH